MALLLHAHMHVSIARTATSAFDRSKRKTKRRSLVENLVVAGPTPSSTRVLVTGGTGGTGKALVEKLAAQGTPVAVLTRNATKAKAALPAVELVEGDLFSYDTAVEAVAGRDIIFICSGTTSRLDPFDPFKIDWQGVENLVAAAKQQGGVKKIIMVSSIGVDDPFFPLNLPFVGNGVLWMKKLGELAVQRSGIDYSIIRPGGLRSTDDGKQRNVVAGGQNTFGLPPRPKLPGSIRRTTVADACIAAMELPEVSRNKIVELVEEEQAPALSWTQVFSSV